jgi:hypothetical protein
MTERKECFTTGELSMHQSNACACDELAEGKGKGASFAPVSPMVDKSLIMRWNSDADILTTAL